jgi:hypothetical protein
MSNIAFLGIERSYFLYNTLIKPMFQRQNKYSTLLREQIGRIFYDNNIMEECFITLF